MKPICQRYGDRVMAGVVSVIPTFRPGASLLPLAKTLSAHGPLVVSDDASPCSVDPLLRQVRALPDVTVIQHRHNAGIARGLNDGLGAAVERGASWLLTVDQDSLVSDSYLADIAAYANQVLDVPLPVGVVGAGTIRDGAGHIRYPLTPLGSLDTTPEVIQTGSLWSVAALTSIGGFDEVLGIDAVDAAACVRLRAAEYVIAVAGNLEVTHRIGSSRSLRLLGRDIMITGHSPERRSTMLRNRLSLFPEEFKQSPRHALRTVRRVAINQTVGLVTERNRFSKARGTMRGLLPQKADTLEP